MTQTTLHKVNGEALYTWVPQSGIWVRKFKETPTIAEPAPAGAKQRDGADEPLDDGGSTNY